MCVCVGGCVGSASGAPRTHALAVVSPTWPRKGWPGSNPAYPAAAPKPHYPHCNHFPCASRPWQFERPTTMEEAAVSLPTIMLNTKPSSSRSQLKAPEVYNWGANAPSQ